MFYLGRDRMKRLTGGFALKEFGDGRLFIEYESGPRPMVSLLLIADRQPRETALELVKKLNLAVAAIEIDESTGRS
jgi:hypothetical protein